MQISFRIILKNIFSQIIKYVTTRNVYSSTGTWPGFVYFDQMKLNLRWVIKKAVRMGLVWLKKWNYGKASNASNYGGGSAMLWAYLFFKETL